MSGSGPGSSQSSSHQNPFKSSEDTVALRTRSKRKRIIMDQQDSPSRSKQVAKVEIATCSDCSEVRECGVCMEAVKKRGMLDVCDHMFCYPCMTKWMKRSNSCPHCKREVGVLKKTDVAGNMVEAITTIRRRTLRDTLDREEFQQRRRQLQQRSHNSSAIMRDANRTGRLPSRTHNRLMPFASPHHMQTHLSFNQHTLSANTTRQLQNNVTQNLLNVHQIIRDSVNTLNTGLQGFQDFMLVNMQPLGLCNIPPAFAANINVSVNGTTLQLGQPLNFALSGYGVMGNGTLGSTMPGQPGLHQFQSMTGHQIPNGITSGSQFSSSAQRFSNNLHQTPQMNPYSGHNGSFLNMQQFPLISANLMAQDILNNSIEILTRLQQNQMANSFHMPPQIQSVSSPRFHPPSQGNGGGNIGFSRQNQLPR